MTMTTDPLLRPWLRGLQGLLRCVFHRFSKVYSRPYSGTKPATSVSTPASGKKENGIHPVFVITVDDPQRVGDPIRAYTMYTVHTKVRIYYLPGMHGYS